MADESTGRGWAEVLGALPFPVAVLDEAYRFVLLNPARAADPILARSRIGETDLECCAGAPEALAQALTRHRRYAQSLEAGEPLAFEEEAPDAGGARRRVRWICVPVRVAEKPYLVVAGPGAGRGGAMRPLLQAINRELRAPLAGTLAHELPGEQQARAFLIDRSGRRLLDRLSLLMEKAERPPEANQDENASTREDP